MNFILFFAPYTNIKNNHEPRYKIKFIKLVEVNI